MALVSPGIQVSVTDQSNYVPAANGTVPFVLLATAENKAAPGGGIASGTLAENAGKLYAITSQRDLVTTFGSPAFQTSASGTAINGSELNEYGLLAAYSALGVSNQVYVQRADINLNEIAGSSARPSGTPADNSYWFDTTATNFGMFVWDAVDNQFTAISPTVDSESIVNSAPDILEGAIGDYLVKTATTNIRVWYKAYNNNWVVAGSTEWQLATPCVTGTQTSPTITANSTVVINGATTTLTVGDNLSTVVSAINSALASYGEDGVLARVVGNAIALSANYFANGGDGTLVLSGTALNDLGLTAGTYYPATVSYAPYYAQPEWNSFDATPRPSGSLWIKTSKIGDGTQISLKKFNLATDQWRALPLNNYYNEAIATYENDPTGGGLNIPVGTAWAKYDVYGNNTVSWSLVYRKNSGATVIIGSSAAISTTTGGDFTLRVSQPTANDYSITHTIIVGANVTAATVVNTIKGLNIPYIQATINADGKFQITHSKGGDVAFVNNSGDILDSLGIDINATNVYLSARGTGTNNYVGTNWAPLTDVGYYVASSQPAASPDDGTLWYWNTPTHIDVMINEGGSWKGYRNVGNDIRGFDLSSTDPNGVQVQSVAPTTQSDGSALVYGDLWIDSSDLENFPMLYRYQRVTGADSWVLINKSDSVSQNGIIFADARWATADNVDPVFGAVPAQKDLILSNYTDLDCPDASLYPRGILMFNTRACSYNVKKYVENYFTEAAYPSTDLPAQKDSWVSVSGTAIGTNLPAFGRHAQRNVVVSAMKSAIDSSTALLEEQNQFNLIACPGYPELIPNMINLNNNRNNTGFIIGDTPLRLPATGTDIIAWAQNSAKQSQTNESGLTNHDPYLAIYYPAGQTNDLSGNSVVVPASHAMIRTFIRSDNASYPWFAPAGTQRGLLDNVNAVGYVDSNTGAFVAIGVTQGLRDTLYTNQINPLTYLQGAGLVCYGNKTLATSPSALDRINVARLINYVRTQLDRLARPFVFEPNDPITRKQIKAVTESLLNDLVAKRGVTDYLVVCDTSNNTPDRIARNELYVDVAIQPTKDVEFIYIPIRLKGPGELESGNVASSLTAGTGA